MIDSRLGFTGDVIRGLIEAEDDIVIVDGEDADVVIVGSVEPVPTDPPPLLAAAARKKALAVSASGRMVTVFSLEPQRTLLGELRPMDLVAAIRSNGSVISTEQTAG